VAIIPSKKLVIITLVLGLVSLIIGGTFIAQGFDKSRLITETMRLEKATYTGEDAKGLISGVIDTAQEAHAMAEVLKEHRLAQGIYTELKRDDPKRATILQAMTMENSLHLAYLGFGLATVVKAVGAFMIIVGLALGLGAYSVIHPKSFLRIS